MESLPKSWNPLLLLRAWLSTTALYFSGVYLPVGGLVLMLFTPQPGLRLERSQGMGALVALVALVALTAALFGGAPAALFYLAAFALVTILLPIWLRRGWSIERTVGATTLLLVAAIAVVVFVRGVTPVALADGLARTLEEGRDTLITVYRDAGASPQWLEQLHELSGSVIGAAVELAPAVVVVALGVAVLLNVWLVRWQQRRSGAAPVFGDLTRWCAPWSLVWVLIASGYAVLVPAGALRAVASNVFAVAVVIYFLQGIAIVQFYFDRWRSPWWARALAYMLVGMQWFVAAGVAAVGVFDLWGDFRRLTPRPLVEDED